ncbi:hypothetical protein [Adhaeretor mobilis]|uniref:PEP-CTERM protein-sorting domain-containing protein n=1 Tax=Adhaeretor mobilis TaxID=1930276 RepID=A0A517MPY0_9BACT|nr:hypothetical protein [Adhaeretor mobilis]QDS96940.1 hypothetical protein HG15A2_01990 [Adhaeretor mobilis]
MIQTQLVGFTNSRNRLAGTIVAVLSSCILFGAGIANAQVIIDSDGFESVGLPPTGSGYDTTFAPGGGLPVGSLEGQHASLPGDSTTAPWLASLGTDSTAVVQTTTVNTGSQAIEVHRETGDSPSFWGVPVTAWPDSARFVCIEWDMYVEGPVGTPGPDFGPYFGVDAIDDASVTGSDFGLIGSLGVLATSGDVVYTDETGSLAPTGSTVGFGAWHHFHIDLDFDLQVYSVILDTVPLLTEPFVGTVSGGLTLEDFSDAPLGTFAAGVDLPATAYFDNYIVYQLNTKIPEPTTMAMGLIALISMSSVSRRRR